MESKSYFFIALLLIPLLLYAPIVQAIAVEPMVLDFPGRPGEQYQFELTISPENEQRVIYLSLYHPTQALDGTVFFTEGDASVYPAIDWVRLERERIVVSPGQPVKVEGTITVPFSAGGSHSVIVMVEPVVEDAEEGVTIIVRYAARVTINVERPGLRSDLKILSTDIIPDEEGKPLLVVHVENPSAFRFPISGESTIRDENRRLVDRVTLKTLSAWESGHDSFAIYPETEVLLVAPINAPLYGGKFYVQNFISYDNAKQVIKGEEFMVEEGQFVNLWDSPILVEPEHMESEIQLGGAATHILQFENYLDEPFHVFIDVDDVVTDYEYSVFDHLELEFRGEQQFTLQPRARGRNVLLVRAPRDATPGGYYGNVNLHVFSMDEEYLDTHTVPLSVLVGREWLRSATPNSLVVEKGDEEYLFSSAIVNTGNVHLALHGTLELRNEDEDTLYAFSLNMAGEQERLLPDATGFLVANVSDDHLLPGEYLATVVVHEGQDQVGIGEFTLIIEEKEQEGSE